MTRRRRKRSKMINKFGPIIIKHNIICSVKKKVLLS